MSEPVIQRDAPSTSPPAPSTATPAPAAGPAGADLNGIAEKVLEVIKREALIERERRGDLI
jgi:hypothetical protein